MEFIETELKGAVLVDVERLEDARGFFARTWCQREFEARGLTTRLVQCNTSFNRLKGTLRGIHYQETPHEEAKLIRCTAGAIYDVIVDLRSGSPSYRKHLGVVLSAENRRSLYVPEGFGHGFLTLCDNVEVFYQMSEFYQSDAARGARWNDPAFNIRWPEPICMMSDRDRGYPDFELRTP